MMIKRVLSVLIICLIFSASVLAAHAETIYILDGYSYSIKDNSSIVLENWDTEINTSLTLPDLLANRSFVGIANRAFKNNTVLQGLDLSGANHLERVGYESFTGCSGITTDLVLPSSLKTIGERSFSDCAGIPSLTILGEVKVIPVECFYKCTSLKTVTLPQSLETIQSWAFGGCSALEYVEIPKGVTSISASAFKNDPNLTLGVWYGSQGYLYAKEQNIPYILIDEVLIGDVNRDDAVSIGDVTSIQRYLVDIEQLDELQLKAADVTYDGVVDMDDATKIQKYLARYFDALCSNS